MSLVGSLEDLGLGDILQIVSLSRKSGVLRLRCDGGEGRIVLQDGMVLGAAVKGDFEDTKSLLLSGDHLSEEQIDDALARAVGRGSPGAALAASGLLSEEELESISRARVESAVMGMFDWRMGEFTFEVRDLVDGSEQAVLLVSPLSTQYIAMEATRKRDEVEHFGDEPFDDEVNGMLFSGEAASADPVDGLALGTLERIEALDDEEDQNDVTQAFATPPVVLEAAEDPFAVAAGADERVSPGPRAARAESVVPELPVQGPAERGHLIAIDPDLAVLEWLKASVGGLFERVHIFQRAEIGVDRIRHYLGRGVTPTILVSRLANADRPGGATELVSRLRALSPAMRVAVLVEQGCEPGPGFEAADGIVERPTSPESDPEQWVHLEAVANSLRSALLPFASRSPASVRPVEAPPDPALVRLKQVSERLCDPASEADVFESVLDFASEVFARVAIFMMRETSVDAIAERGVGRSGGPSDERLAELSFSHEEQPEVFRRVLERRVAIVSSLAGEGDERLATLLGISAGRHAYLAPIESGGCVIGFLYADNQPLADAIPDTTALEIVLHEAGLSHDRARLRRALAEAEDRALT
jgi:hypothetical protein